MAELPYHLNPLGVSQTIDDVIDTPDEPSVNIPYGIPKSYLENGTTNAVKLMSGIAAPGNSTTKNYYLDLNYTMKSNSLVQIVFTHVGKSFLNGAGVQYVQSTGATYCRHYIGVNGDGKVFGDMRFSAGATTYMTSEMKPAKGQKYSLLLDLPNHRYVLKNTKTGNTSTYNCALHGWYAFSQRPSFTVFAGTYYSITGAAYTMPGTITSKDHPGYGEMILHRVIIFEGTTMVKDFYPAVQQNGTNAGGLINLLAASKNMTKAPSTYFIKNAASTKYFTAKLGNNWIINKDTPTDKTNQTLYGYTI